MRKFDTYVKEIDQGEIRIRYLFNWIVKNINILPLNMIQVLLTYEYTF